MLPFCYSSNLTHGISLNLYESTSTPNATVLHRWPTNWILDAIVLTWIATGLSAFGLAILGSAAMLGSPAALFADEDAYIGLIAVPFLIGFVAIGASVGAFYRSHALQLIVCFVPLFLFATVLFLADYLDDLGEGEQVVTYYATGLFIGGVSAIPAFLIRRKGHRIFLLFVPHMLVAFCYAGFVANATG